MPFLASVVRFLRCRPQFRLRGLIAATGPWFGLLDASAQMPENPVVVRGDVSVSAAGNRLDVTQGSPYGIVNWDAFSIGAGNTVHFANGSGATLNRVTGLTASAIDGTLSATGSLYLLNRNGIIIGSDGRVLTGGDFVASTLDLTDEDFLNGGSFSLLGTTQAGVTNLGKISALGGDVLLAGYTVSNAGDLAAAGGRVGLAAGTRIDVLTDVSWLDGAFAVSLGERGQDITNEGRIQALVAELRTHHGNIYALAGNNDGLIQATGVRNEGGRVILTADEGTVQSSGAVVATRDQDGGDIEITATAIENYGGTQDVSGATGGSIRLTADAVITDTMLLARGTAGPGGSIVVEAADELLVTAAGLFDASGATGGEILLDAGVGGLAFSGRATAAGAAGQGGDLVLGGHRIALLGGGLNADGATGGGAIAIGGGFHGEAIRPEGGASPLADWANAERTFVSEKTSLSADATGAQGDGGEVVVWADGTTEFAGTITARGGTVSGDGGMVETSGLEGLGTSGTVDASARGAGADGSWLLDPRNLVIGTAPTDALTEFQDFLAPNGGINVDDIGFLKFGLYLDVDGDTAVIGPDSSAGAGSRGVYVFEGGQIAARLTGEGSLTSTFGMGVGVEGDFIAVMDPRVGILHTPNNAPSYSTVGAVYLFHKGSVWRNGSLNRIARLYNDGNRDFFSEWGLDPDYYFSAPQDGNTRFATMLDDAGLMTIVVGNPTQDAFGITDAGGVDTFTFSTGGNLPSGDRTNWSTLTVATSGTPQGLRFGDYVTASEGFIYAGTGTTVSAQANDLYVHNIHQAYLGTIRFPNLFGSRPSFITADGTDLFAITGGLLNSTRFTWGGAADPFAQPRSNGVNAVAIDTRSFSTTSFPNAVTAVAVDGDHMIVSLTNAANRAGAIGIYEKPADATWTSAPGGAYAPVFTHTLNNGANATEAQDGGMPLAISGDYALAGIPLWDASASIRDRGAVAQFRRVDGSWNYDGLLRPTQAWEFSGFGHVALDIDGDTFAIGDPGFADATLRGANAGRIYVYQNGVLAAALTSGSAADSTQYFGRDLALDDGRLVTVSTSSLYLFAEGSGWRNGAANLVSSYQVENGFTPSLGYQSVAIDGNTVVAGAPFSNLGWSGAIDIFTLNGGSLGTPERIRPTGYAFPTVPDSFGYRVAVSGNTVAATRFDNWNWATDTFTGSPSQIIVIENNGGAWASAPQTALTLTGSLTGNEDGYGFGRSLALAGDTLVAGFEAGSGFVNGRGVYVFERNGSWANSTTPVARLLAPGYGFGYSVDTDGDRIAISTPEAAVRGSPGLTYDPLYLFERGGGWQNGDANLLATLKIDTPVSAWNFLGFSVALDGDRVLAGNNSGTANSFFLTGVYDFAGPFDLAARGTFASNPSGTLNISAASLANSLSAGTDITLQANNDITISAALIINNAQGDGGDLTLQAGRRILVNASITTDNGNLTLIAGDPNAIAAQRSAGEQVVVLGRDATNQGVVLNLGTGHLTISAPDRFENRTGATNPFAFDATNPGDFLIYTRTPDHTGAPDTANLGADLAVPGWDFVLYNTAADVANLRPASLPAGSGFVYTVQPAVGVNVGNATITYGQTVPAAALSLAGVTVNGNPVDAAVFGLTTSDLAPLVDTGLASGVSVNSAGFAQAGTYAGAITAVAKATVDSGRIYGVAVTTGAAGDLTVNRAVLDVRPDAATRTYRAADPTFTATYTGFVTGDDASGLDTPVTITSNAGPASAVGGYTLTASGGLDNNYTFNITGTGLLTVTPAMLTLTGLTGVDRVYDRTTAAEFTGTAAIAPFAGDDVRLTGTLTATATFADANVGSAKPLAVTGFGLTGAAAANYTLVLPTNLTASITPAPLEITGLTVASRTYDGTTAATLEGTPAVMPLSGDTVTLTGTPTAAFADAAAGANKPIVLSGLALSGPDAGNYALATANLLAAIFQREVTLGGYVFSDRSYNGSSLVTPTGTPTLDNLPGDDVSLTGTLVASTADKNVGAAKPVTLAGLALAGADAPNYVLRIPTYVVSITPADLGIAGLTAVSRTYNGTPFTTLIGTPILNGYGSDQLTLGGAPLATFADGNAGVDKPVTVTGFTLGGADAANYTLQQPAGLTASIDPLPLSLTGIHIADRLYDTTTAAQLASPAQPGLAGALANDDVTLDLGSLVFAFAAANVGAANPVALTAGTLTGADAANYTLAPLAGITAAITPVTLELTGVTAADRTYNGTTAAALSGGALLGVLGTDQVGLDASAATGTFADANVGSAKTVTLAGYTLTGSAALNYLLAPLPTLTADIAAASLQLLGLRGDKVYDGSTAAPLTFTGLAGLFGDDAVQVDASAVSGSYANKQAGADKTVDLTGTFALTGAAAANYVLVQPAVATGTIARRGVTVQGVTIADKVYDGTTAGTIFGNGTFGGLVAGDDVTMDVGSVEITFADKNVGSNKLVAISGISISGPDAGNYDVGQAAGLTASITPATLSLTGVSALDRTYDGTTAATLTGGALSGVFGNDAVLLDATAAAGHFADKHLGTDKPVTATGYALTGLDATNYLLLQPTGLTADIAARILGIVGLNGDKVYDGALTTTLTFTGLDDVVAGDLVTLDTSAVAGTYADKNAGAAKPVALTGSFALTGADAANYRLTPPASLTGTISPRPLVLTGAAVADKTYDGTTAGTFAQSGSFSGAVAGDNIAGSTAQATVTFADRNAGRAKPVAVSGLTLSGADAANYTAVAPADLTAAIEPRTLTVTGLTAADQVYDRTAAATLAGTATLSGGLATDDLSLDATAVAGAFADKHAGTDRTVTVTGLTLGGADAANYLLTAPLLTADITAATVIVLGLEAVDRVYDATRNAPLTGTPTLDFGVLAGVLDSTESVQLAGTATGLFADRNVGPAKAVTVAGLGLAGADAANYTLQLPTDLVAAVTPATLAVTGTAVGDKVYDATTAAPLTAVGTITPFVGDAVQLAGTPTAAFADKNVGSAKPVTLSGYTLAGADAGNYVLTTPVGLTAAVTPADLLVAGIVADDRTYDGTTTAPLSGTLAVVPLGTDDVRVAGAPVATFADAQAGAGKPVTVTGLRLAGTDATNYRLTLPALTADILQRVLTLGGITALDRVYDATTRIALGGAPTLANVVAGDLLSYDLSALIASVMDRHVGTAKAVTLSGDGLTGAAAANYTVVLPFDLTATISPRDLTVTGVDAVDRAYDGSTAVALTGGALAGTLVDDVVSLQTAAARGTLADKNAGTDKPVTAAGYTLTGTDAVNYRLAQPAGVTVTITPKVIGIDGLEVADKFFDGTTTATLSGGTLNGIVTGDDLRLLTGTGRGTFDTPDVGNNKPVTPLELALAGADAANYRIDPALDLRGNILAALQVITDVIPAEVLRASAEADLAQQRAALEALANAAPDAVTFVDFEAVNAQVSAGIPVPNVSPAVLALAGAADADSWSLAYANAANAAQTAAAEATAAAQTYREVAREHKELGQSFNALDRALQTEQGLRDTFVAQIERAEGELAKIEENLATIAEAKRRVESLSRQMADAERLGRGSEAADYAAAIAEARAVIATESTLLAQRDQLAGEVAAGRDRLAASEAKVAALTAEKDDIAARINQTEATLQAARQNVDAAKARAITANETLERSRELGESRMAEVVAELDSQLAALRNQPAPDVPGGVAAALQQYGTNQAGIERLLRDYPLSEERAAAVQAVVEEWDAKVARGQELQQIAAAGEAAVKDAPPVVSARVSEIFSARATRDLDSAALAALDLSSLGVRDEDILPSNSGVIMNLNSEVQGLSNALAKLGPIGTMVGPRAVQVGNLDPRGGRGVGDIDQPITLDPVVENSLRNEMQQLGVLPTFTAPALKDLPLTQQLQLAHTMREVKAAQERAVAEGRDPDQAALEAFDKKSADFMTMVLFEQFDSVGVGDIPGTQAAVSAAIGEMAAQFGVSPSALTLTVVNGDTNAILGAPEQAARAVGNAAAAVVRDPVGAGVQLAKGAGEVLEAAGKAFIGAWTGSGPPPDPAAAQRATEERIRQLTTVGSLLAGVETRRQQAVAERDAGLQQVKDTAVAYRKGIEANGEWGSLGGDRLTELRDGFVLRAQTEAAREQVGEVISARTEHQEKLAALEAQREAANAKLTAFAASGPGGGNG